MDKNQEILNRLIYQAESFGVKRIANSLLLDSRFPVWSGSCKPQQHHYGTGGLLVHTDEVTQMCLLLRDKYYPGLEPRPIFLAALFHDWGKLWDYQPQSDPIAEDTQWGPSEHKRLIHHISRSAIEWSKAVHLTGECLDIYTEVTHAILAHHGQRAWGSPVSPRTQLAWLLHLCDGISARMNDCDKLDYCLYRESGEK